MKKLQNIASVACLIACGALLSLSNVGAVVDEHNINVFDYSVSAEGQQRDVYAKLFDFVFENYGSECKVMVHLNNGDKFDGQDSTPTAVMVNHPYMKSITVADFIHKLEDADEKNAKLYRQSGLVASASMTMAHLQVSSEKESQAILDLKGSGLCAVHETHPGELMVGGTTEALRKIADVVPYAKVVGHPMTHIHLISHASAHKMPKVEDVLREHAKTK